MKPRKRKTSPPALQPPEPTAPVSPADAAIEKEKGPAVSFAKFHLSFMDLPFVNKGDDEDPEEPPSRRDILERMQANIPDSAVDVGNFRHEVSNWTSWRLDEYFYVTPWDRPGFDWALFRITWDDNWGRYHWETCARITGVKQPRAAARAMVGGLFEKWGVDLEKEENAAFQDFLDGI